MTEAEITRKLVERRRKLDQRFLAVDAAIKAWGQAPTEENWRRFLSACRAYERLRDEPMPE